MKQLSPCARTMSLCSRAQELQLLKPTHPRARAPQEKPLQWEACRPKLEKTPCSNVDPAQPKQATIKRKTAMMVFKVVVIGFFLFFTFYFVFYFVFPGGTRGKEHPCQCRRWKRHGLDPSWVGKIPWRRTWQPTPVFLPGESHGQRSLAGYSPYHRTVSDTTEIT